MRSCDGVGLVLVSVSASASASAVVNGYVMFMNVIFTHWAR